MSDKELIALNGKVLEIETKPITLILKESPHDVEYSKRVKITLESSLYHIERTKTFHALTGELTAAVFPELEGDYTPNWIREQGLAVKHVAGRIELTLKFMDLGIPIAWVYPEAGLHPKAELKLGDLAIFFSNYKK